MEVGATSFYRAVVAKKSRSNAAVVATPGVGWLLERCCRNRPLPGLETLHFMQYASIDTSTDMILSEPNLPLPRRMLKLAGDR